MPMQIQRSYRDVAGVTLLTATNSDGAVVDGPVVAVVALMHGNEPVGGGVHARLLDRATEHLTAGSILLVAANLKAAEMDLRHTPEGQDLNRLWDRNTLDTLAGRDPESLDYEEQRVLQLAPIVTSADAIMDLHSTSRPSAPFLLFRDDVRHGVIAKKLGVRYLATGLHENGILSGGLCSNSGLRPAERSERLGFTFEAGQHTSDGNVERATAVVERFLEALGLWRDAPPVEEPQSEVFEVTERFRQAPEGSVPYRFVGFEGGEPGGGRHGPLRRLHSFEEVQADEVLLRRGEETVIRARTPFTMLMPAPDTAPGTDLYYVTQPRHGGLASTPLDDPAARASAVAIERMMDLLADDDFARGSSWVAFDSRRLFDLCAETVGATLRLPPGHPHRRVTVVGRGDTGSDEAERRAGARYRQAMRMAVSEGLPVERFQLLRGARLAWLDALTSASMLTMMQKRADLGAPGVKMRLSLKQPHTASLLVAGDLEHALKTGETRNVRVCLLVEAATVEPGIRPRVRVVRAGMVSGRPEVLQSALSVIGALRHEHLDQVHHGAFRDEAAIHELLADDGAIVSRPDSEQLVRLRASLGRIQIGLWCDLLRHELPEERRFSNEAELGRWLAATMAATGILDVGAVKALSLRAEGEGWIASPEILFQMEQRVRRGSMPLSLASPQPASPPLPLMAAHVDADDLERWVGWKRFVRGANVVPHTRGKDLDLAFSEAQIRMRLGRWYEEASDRAAAEPGKWMLVVAGDGLNPTRDRLDSAAALIRAHRRLLKDPNLHYLRIQHAQGTHLSWMKDLIESLSQRPSGQSVALQWEVEHGQTVNVVLLARQVGDPEGREPWSLEGWRIERCAVVLADLQAQGTDGYQVAMFTERDFPGLASVNAELLAFGRTHCEGLLRQAGWRVRGEAGSPPVAEFEGCMVGQISRWIERVRVWRHASATAPLDRDARGRWVARRLGLRDARLARALAVEMERDTPVDGAAKALWESVPAWPGRALSDDAEPMR